MISQLHIENFRSIEKATIDLGRITVLTGSNNSGKSSLIYALFCLRGIIKNPNRTIDNIFNIPDYINLGTFKEVVFLKNENRIVTLGLTIKTNNWNVDFSFELNPVDSRVNHKISEPFIKSFTWPLLLPSTNGKHFEVTDSEVVLSGMEGMGLYIGSISYVKFNEWVKIDDSLTKELNFFHLIDLIPTRRGFFQSSFGMVPLQVDAVKEDEIATQISLDLDLQGYISHYLEKIAGRQFNVRVIPNTAVFYMQTTDVKTGFTTDLVNEGTGTNQLITMLAKALQPDKKFICIDEPEIHLHPSMIAKLVEALVEIAYTQEKQFMLSTHSEHFVTCLLAEVVKKNLQPDDLKVYYLTKDNLRTNIEHQMVNADGQIEGGLKNFYEAELQNLETFFKIA